MDDTDINESIKEPELSFVRVPGGWRPKWRHDSAGAQSDMLQCFGINTCRIFRRALGRSALKRGKMGDMCVLSKEKRPLRMRHTTSSVDATRSLSKRFVHLHHQRLHHRLEVERSPAAEQESRTLPTLIEEKSESESKSEYDEEDSSSEVGFRSDEERDEAIQRSSEQRASWNCLMSTYYQSILRKPQHEKISFCFVESEEQLPVKPSRYRSICYSTPMEDISMNKEQEEFASQAGLSSATGLEVYCEAMKFADKDLVDATEVHLIIRVLGYPLRYDILSEILLDMRVLPPAKLKIEHCYGVVSRYSTKFSEHVKYTYHHLQSPRTEEMMGSPNATATELDLEQFMELAQRFKDETKKIVRERAGFSIDELMVLTKCFKDYQRSRSKTVSRAHLEVILKELKYWPEGDEESKQFGEYFESSLEEPCQRFTLPEVLWLLQIYLDQVAFEEYAREHKARRYCNLLPSEVLEFKDIFAEIATVSGDGVRKLFMSDAKKLLNKANTVLQRDEVAQFRSIFLEYSNLIPLEGCALDFVNFLYFITKVYALNLGNIQGNCVEIVEQEMEVSIPT
eukprot:GEMP01029620.1.p1 GENE.GEMP01029620.1~~GEMP01029620.1.p1  ORF type:complete len:568 (+),score=85.42 GEMP01029620.1:70-1773(+)